MSREQDSIYQYLDSQEAIDDLKDLEWVCFTDKYKDTNICFKSSGWNVEVNGNFKPDYFPKTKNIVNFYDKLAQRIELALNYVKGKTEEELKQLIDSTK